MSVRGILNHVPCSYAARPAEKLTFMSTPSEPHPTYAPATMYSFPGCRLRGLFYHKAFELLEIVDI